MLRAARKFARAPIIVTCFGVAVLGSMAGGNLSPAIGVALLAIVLLIIHGNSINDLADYEIDKVNLKNAKDRPLVSGEITVQQLWWLSSVCGILAILLAFFYGPVAGAATIAVAIYNYLYSLKPLRITDRTVFSPLTLASTYSLLPFTLGYLSSEQTLSYPWLLAAALYFGFIARLLLKDFRDVKGDAKFGKQTFLIRYGSRLTCAVSAYCGLASLILIGIAINFSLGGLAVLVAGNVAAVVLLARLAKATRRSTQLQLISVVAKIGNGSILTILIYYLCRNYAPEQTAWMIALPALVGFSLLYLTWRGYVRDAQVQLA